MLKTNLLSAIDGTQIYVCPTVEAYRTDTGYVLINEDAHSLSVNADYNCLISVEAKQALLQRGICKSSKSLIFSNPPLTDAVFDWNLKNEIQCIDQYIKKLSAKSTIYDAGCGVGRVTKYFSQKYPNHDYIAIDCSEPLIRYFNQEITTDNIMGIAADICNFTMPEKINVCFSALNTIRYLDSFARVLEHFRSVLLSLKSKGKYFFQCTISDSPKDYYCNEWSFDFQGVQHTAIWERYDYALTDKRIIDKVTIKNKKNIVVTEYQEQIHLSIDDIKFIFDCFSQDFRLLKITDANNRFYTMGDIKSGNYWFIVEKI